jgi:hypothetical protein
MFAAPQRTRRRSCSRCRPPRRVAAGSGPIPTKPRAQKSSRRESRVKKNCLEVAFSSDDATPPATPERAAGHSVRAPPFSAQRMVLRKRALRELVGVDRRLLLGQKVVDLVADRQTARLGSGNPAGLQAVLPFPILPKCRIRIGTGTQRAEPPRHLLAPSPRKMGGSGKSFRGCWSVI